MAKLRLSKQSLSREREQLKLYQRLLPSLDLKRRQLTVELEKARAAATEAHAAGRAGAEIIGRELPMLADRELDLGRLVCVENVRIGQENVVGVKLPRLEEVRFETQSYALLGRPAWVDVACARVREGIEARLQLQVAEERAGVLARAVRRITQRVNLFERVLIPGAKRNIKRIQIFLGDLERDAVVRSKLAKGRGRGKTMEPRPADPVAGMTLP